MKSGETGLLTTTVDVVNGWQVVAKNANVTIDEMTLVFPSGDAVKLTWNEETDDWGITTAPRTATVSPGIPGEPPLE